MSEHEIVDTFRACGVIYKNLNDRRNLGITRAEMATLRKIKAICNKDLRSYKDLMDTAGISQDELAFLATYIYYIH